jgi:hypothetical protein
MYHHDAQLELDLDHDAPGSADSNPDQLPLPLEDSDPEDTVQEHSGLDRSSDHDKEGGAS